MRIRLEQSKTETLTGTAGLMIVGEKLSQVKPLVQHMRNVEKRHGIANIDLVRAYIGLLAQGKNDFEALDAHRHDMFFKNAMKIKQMPSESRLRQRFDEDAPRLIEELMLALPELFLSLNIQPGATREGWVPLDVDLYPLDNSKTQKEGVERTYKGFDGYGAMAAYLGVEGWSLLNELRKGSQHPQKNFKETLKEVVSTARKITDGNLLLRLDAAHDADDTLITCSELSLDYIIRWNPRKTDVNEVYETHLKYWVWKAIRPGKRVGFSEEIVKIGDDEIRLVFRLTETTESRTGQKHLIPHRELSGWWTNISEEKLSAKQVEEYYRDHATCEQFHSEFKTDMDLERLPSGKFSTNQLVLVLAQYTYNLLRWIGLNGLLGKDSPKRKKAQRRRIRTVIQEIIYRAAKLITHARSTILRFGKNECNYDLFSRVYHC